MAIKRKGIITIALAAAIAAPLMTGNAAAAGKLKVAFVEFAQSSGSSWVRANMQGADYLKAHVPNLDITRVQAVPDGPGVVPVMNSLIAKGNTVIFADSYGYGTFVPGVARKHPNIYFIVQEAEPKGPNIASYYGKLEQVRYLEGVLAGKMTKSNIVGFVGAYPYAVVVSGVNAFALGVHSVNSKAKVLTNWVNSWYDPPKEKEAADSLLNAGADIIANHCDSAATLQAAAARGKWGMTSNADWSSAAPKAFLTGSAWNWGPYYVKVINEIKAHKFKPGRYLATLADGTEKLLPYGPAVTEQAKKAVAAAKRKIISGQLKVFAGPIYDNHGKLRIPSGQAMSSQESISKMNWLVAGVTGSTK